LTPSKLGSEQAGTAGFGGEIVARIAENVLGSLDAPVVRIDGGWPIPQCPKTGSH
jgi:pyruvate/2-oxoglutarate/acetoin dehydrogenase E1 component